MEVRIRYRWTFEKATLYRGEGGLYVLFDNSQSAIAERQFIPWYYKDECLDS
ncbi:aminomethyltransferase beta-barrel domain-containing protein [Olleya sp. Bg11-27]|uniref:aminomethyltransferase beta-barrel domain-containing protein n=1 Tax=Olleya sp. Bg11-27 TaxID=2058135 RepID=UPI003977714F